MIQVNKFIEIIKDNWNKLEKNNKLYIIAFLTLGFISIYNELKGIDEAHLKPEVKQNQEEIESIDTYIPKGFVLIPIDLVNRESIISIIDQTSLVDLYYQKRNQSKSIKIASRVKLIRAPLNPNQLAVLISENESHQILAYEGPYFAVIQNKREKAIGILQSQKKVNIVFQN